MTDNDQIVEKAKALNEEIRELRTQLLQLNDQKEAFYKQKEEVGAQIRALIGGIKSEKKERNKLTDSVKVFKEKRTELNTLILKKIEEIKALKAKVKPGPRKGPKENPGFIKKQIEKIEYHLETEVMKFEKEKKIMKEIKQLKKKLAGFSEGGDTWNQIHALSKELDKLRSTADEKHRNIQVSAKKSQEHHEAILKTATAIDELKKKEDEFSKKFLEKKKEFTEVNTKLKAKLEQLNPLNQQLGVKKKHDRRQRESKQKIKLKEKKKAAEEKLKQRKKLTTEDILAMQSED